MKRITLFSFLLCLSVLFVFGQETNYMLNNGLGFLDTPYMANTLEINKEEELVVNCDEVDCTTYVEYVLAMSLCSRQGDEMIESEFANNLQKIRYRNGVINGYPSRLHYITDWVADNVRMGLIDDITARKSKETTFVSVNYMTSNPDKYEHLRNSPANTSAMAEYERQLSGKRIHYLPINQLSVTGNSWIKNGDIIAMVTNTPGLDISHLGIAIYIKGNLHLLHASSKEGKVVVERTALKSSLAKDKSIAGIRVLRMKSK